MLNVAQRDINAYKIDGLQTWPESLLSNYAVQETDLVCNVYVGYLLQISVFICCDRKQRRSTFDTALLQTASSLFT